MQKIVFLDRGTLGPSVHVTRPKVAHHWTEYDATHPDQLLERLDGASVAITNKVPLRGPLLEQLPALKLIVVAATGYDVIDMDYCRAHGITVCNVRGYARNTVPEHALALIFALRRSLVGYREDVMAGEWQKSGQFCFFNHPISDLAGSTLGIIGKGALGQALGTLGDALGMKVQYAGYKNAAEAEPGFVDFDEFLRTSDIISLHCPLTPQTRDLLAFDEFRKMARKPILINTGRGGLVNEADCVRALDEGLLAGIGFDCLTSEPMATEHPFHAILGRPNVIVTPHVAWASAEAMQTLWDQVVSHIDNFAAGAPTNVLN
ncbi:D-3-phosphoglycerate dehydrogenase [Marinobacterium lacunae]|uniref:D-3-phosphoglycerate dehydrogenase n=1 Tax=Marinobacterium lacunae TaxID=1232683 RepID=A0A081FUR7_9GAMM|nr:D-2-hydroxyacid dehydrogenase [Marinobacterium lacunae]KEA62272.1 D-3-phosphoglycerate dehydrogenase [Marinobacterium lacunae]